MLNTKPLFICSLMNHFWSLTSKMFSFQPDDQLLFLHWMLLKLCATQHHLILEILYYAAHVYQMFMLLVRPHLVGLPHSACVYICCIDERGKLWWWLKTHFKKYQSTVSLICIVVMLSVCKNSWVAQSRLFYLEWWLGQKSWHQPCIFWQNKQSPCIFFFDWNRFDISSTELI